MLNFKQASTNWRTSTIMVGSRDVVLLIISTSAALSRDAGAGGAGGAAAPLAFCWEGQGGQKCPLSIKNII